MNEIVNFFQFILSSEEIIHTGGIIAIFLIVFIENGFFFGFFLPGDYLLFLSGVFCATQILHTSFPILFLGIFLAAVLGSFVGYLSGKYFGTVISNKKDSLFFKQKYLTKSRKYFDRYGRSTLIIARFLPIIRTFTPILAGMSDMKFPIFSLYNVLGGLIWVSVLVGGGYFFGEKFPWIVNYVHYIILFFLILTTFTAVKSYLTAKREFED